MRGKVIFTSALLLGILLVSMVLTALFSGKNQKAASLSEEEDPLLVVTSFYPMYIATLNLTEGIDGITVENLSEPQTGCLHDYQLTTQDMLLLSKADVFVVNGGGIETFLSDVAESYPKLTIVNASDGAGILLEEEEGVNAHAWMDVTRYEKQLQVIADGLIEATGDASDAGTKDFYVSKEAGETTADNASGNVNRDARDKIEQNLADYCEKLKPLKERMEALKEKVAGENVILFHEAYAYVADALGMHVVYVMDLDEERQVSAGEVADVVSEVKNGQVDYIFAEELYGKEMGDMVAKESGATVLYLDTLVRGNYDADSYLLAYESNLELLEGAFQ